MLIQLPPFVFLLRLDEVRRFENLTQLSPSLQPMQLGRRFWPTCPSTMGVEK